jgi:hypothetical protein
MLSKSDKDFIRQAIREEVKRALTVKVRFEKRRDLKTGQPLAVPEIEVKDVFLPEHWVEFLPFYEGAIRGSQEQVCNLQTTQAKNTEAIAAIANILTGAETSILAFIEKVTQARLMISDTDKALTIEHQNIS